MVSAQEYAAGGGFLSFARAFEKEGGLPVPVHLVLLNLGNSAESEVALQVVVRAMEASPDITAEVAALFSERDWRPHIVGCIAMLLGAVNDATIRALWKAFENGSWGSPQIAATALHCDPLFGSEARKYIEVIKKAELSGFDSYWAKDVSAPVPFTTFANFGKSISALVGLCETIPDAAPWLAEAREHPNLQTVIDPPDVDGGRAARYWRRQVEKVIDKRKPTSE